MPKITPDSEQKGANQHAYKTIEKASLAEFIINKSRFIGRCFPVESEEQSTAILGDIKKKHYDASHNCFAYAVGQTFTTARYSDDGEPGGTAGLPIMQVIKHKGITNVLCVVTRYFGGVLLGAGGLVRAYSRAAAEAVDAAGIIRIEPGSEMELTFDYDLYSKLEGYIQKRVQVLACEFADKVQVRVLLPTKQEPLFIKEIEDKCFGRVHPVKICEKFMICKE